MDIEDHHIRWRMMFFPNRFSSGKKMVEEINEENISQIRKYRSITMCKRFSESVSNVPIQRIKY